jgi:replicative DNA helicase Mcm
MEECPTENVKKVYTNVDIAQIWTKLINEDLYFSAVLADQFDEVVSIPLDLVDLDLNHPEAFETFIQNPILVISHIRTVVMCQRKASGQIVMDVNVYVKNFNNLPKETIRRLRAHSINKLVVFDGIARITTPIQPKLKITTYRCNGCNQFVEVVQDGDEEIKPDANCPGCNNPHAEYTLLPERSVFTNFMKSEIEEEPEGLRGKQPEKIPCELTGALTDESIRICAGERVSLIGIYSVRRKDKKTLLFDKYISVLGIDKRSKTFEELVIDDDEKTKYEETAKVANLLSEFSKAVAPNIEGYTIEKMALLLQLLGGDEYSDRRGQIHILVVGEPGVGKSSMIKNHIKIAPHVVQASGGPSSSVGLTAMARRDDQSNQWYLDAGAAVLASGGLIVIDEFDKMNKETQGALHEIMEEGKCTVAKANVNAQLQAKTAFLAIMNPRDNRFKKDEPKSEQINLQPSMISRFDLIFALEDVVDEEKDRRITEAIDRARSNEAVDTPYSQEFITKYITYARAKIHGMTKSPEAKKKMQDKYLKIRQKNKDSGVIAITNRQYEGISRLAEAHAKLRLSPIVEEQDADVAIRIVEYYLNTMALDPATGEINVDMVTGGKSQTAKNNERTLYDIIVEQWKEEVERCNGTGCDPLLDINIVKELFVDSCGHSEKEYEKSLASLKEIPKIILRNQRYITDVRGD